MQKKKKEIIGYIPPDAGLNFTNQVTDPPKTQYEKRRETFKIEKVKDLTKGKYGRD
jgi:hypothetical protein